jgi:hypothetical protein
VSIICCSIGDALGSGAAAALGLVPEHRPHFILPSVREKSSLDYTTVNASVIERFFTIFYI